MDQLASLPQTDNNGQLLEKWFSAAATGDLKTIEQLLDSGEININQTRYEGDTELHIAISHLKINVVKYFIEHGSDINTPVNQHGYTPFTLMINIYLSSKLYQKKEIVAEYGLIINDLLHGKANINKKNDGIQTAFSDLFVYKEIDTKLITNFLKMGADPLLNAPDRFNPLLICHTRSCEETDAIEASAILLRYILLRNPQAKLPKHIMSEDNYAKYWEACRKELYGKISLPDDKESTLFHIINDCQSKGTLLERTRIKNRTVTKILSNLHQEDYPVYFDDIQDFCVVEELLKTFDSYCEKNRSRIIISKDLLIELRDEISDALQNNDLNEIISEINKTIKKDKFCTNESTQFLDKLAILPIDLKYKISDYLNNSDIKKFIQKINQITGDETSSAPSKRFCNSNSSSPWVDIYQKFS